MTPDQRRVLEIALRYHRLGGFICVPMDEQIVTSCTDAGWLKRYAGQPEQVRGKLTDMPDFWMITEAGRLALAGNPKDEPNG